MRPLIAPLPSLLTLVPVLVVTACASAPASRPTTEVRAFNAFATGQEEPPEAISGCERRGVVAATGTAAPGSYSSATALSLVETLRSKARRLGANTLVVSYGAPTSSFSSQSDEGTRLRGVAFLCSAAAQDITGACLPIDGGWSVA